MSPSRPVSPTRARNKKRASNNPVRLLASHAVDAVLNKKAHDVTVMDMHGVSGVADIFIICTGDSDLQVKAIADSVIEKVREDCGERPWHVEGYEHLQWVLVDYVDLVVHVFSPDKRAFYSLERLWGDAPLEHVPGDGSSGDVQLLKEQPVEKKRAEGGT